MGHFLFTCSDTSDMKQSCAVFYWQAIAKHGLFPSHLLRYFCFKMYCLATIFNFITDRCTEGQSDRWQYHANSRSYCTQQL